MNVSHIQFPFALFYFTGPDHFNRSIRNHASLLGFSLSDYVSILTHNVLAYIHGKVLYTYIYATYIYTHIHIYIHAYMHTHIQMYIHAYVHTHTHMH